MLYQRVPALFSVFCCKCRHNTHSLIDTGGFDWVIRSTQVTPWQNIYVKSSIRTICQNRRGISLICNPSDSIPLTVTACHNIWSQFASYGNPSSVEHLCKFLESNIFHQVGYFPDISFQNQQLSCLCIVFVKSQFFSFCLYDLGQIFQDIPLDAVQQSSFKQ